MRRLFALLACIACCACSQSDAMRSDAEMLRHLADHRADFERLVAMVGADTRLQHVARDSVAPADALTQARLAEYRTLLSRLGLSRVSNAEGAVKLAVEGTHMLSYDKGYLHAAKPPSPLADSLDLASSDIKPNAQLYKRIEGDWYLYFHNPWD